MRLKSLKLDGFRGHVCEIALPGPLSVVVGANNAGKSNVIDALRTVLWPADGPRARRWVTAADFAHDSVGAICRDEFTIEVVLSDLNAGDEAVLVTCLSQELGGGYAKLRAHARLRASGMVDLEVSGGDTSGGGIDQLARQAVQFVYLPTLRDAERELRPGQANRVASLLKSRVPAGHNDRAAMEAEVTRANTALESIPSMVAAEESIKLHLRAMSGARFAQPSDLRFAPATFEAIVRQLSAHAGHIPTLDLDRNGLGSNNLLFMATLLSALNTEQEGAVLSVLLVEEPEAHLHPQLQDLLMRFLEAPLDALGLGRARAGGGSELLEVTPVHSVVTSHSPNVAAAAGIERVTVLTRENPHSPSVSTTPATFGMDRRALGHLRRYLDVTKAGLLFSSGVILVEGIAEQLVVPALAQSMGSPLHDHGVAIVNVDGLAFGPFVDLFAPGRLPHRCAVLTDGDVEVSDPGSDPALSDSTASLLARVEGWSAARIFYNEQTFEVELGLHGEWDILVDAMEQIHSRVAAGLRDYADSPPADRARALLGAIERNRAKGRFAQALTAVIDDGARLTPPPYIADAIRFVCEVSG